MDLEPRDLFLLIVEVGLNLNLILVTANTCMNRKYAPSQFLMMTVAIVQLLCPLLPIPGVVWLPNSIREISFRGG